jgi:hypothetical protein
MPTQRSQAENCDAGGFLLWQVVTAAMWRNEWTCIRDGQKRLALSKARAQVDLQREHL